MKNRSGLNLHRTIRMAMYINNIIIYVATDLFDRSYGAKFANAFTVRNHSDYDDFYLFSTEETVALTQDAEQFLEDVRVFLAKKGVF